MNKKLPGVIYILIAAALFGCVSLFLGGLTAVGTTRLQIIMLRSWITVLLLACLSGFKDKRLPTFRLKDSWIFAAYGIINMIFFSVCYWWSMELVGVSISSILIYTAPVFALVISALFFGEKINKKCVVALIMAISGVICVSGIGTGASISPVGFVLGIFAGFLYSLQGIWSRIAIQRGYRPWDITLCATLFCAVCSTPVALADPLPRAFFSSPVCILLITGMSVFCIMIPNILYAKGLETIPVGRASMLTSVEPAVATVIGIVVFHERLTISAIAGIIIIIIAVCILVSDQ